MDTARIAHPTVTRLPAYLQVLAAAADAGSATISSDDLAAAAGVNSAIVRKDLSSLGSFGTRGVGYHIGDLVGVISATLGLTHDWAVAIVGIGNLGRALARYGGFRRRGFRVAALIDSDPAKVGEPVEGLVVEPLAAIEEVVGTRGVRIGVITTPAAAAQQVADALVAAGVTAILNFAPAHLAVSDAVTVRKVDLSSELAILAFYEQLQGGDLRAADSAEPASGVGGGQPLRSLPNAGDGPRNGMLPGG